MSDYLRSPILCVVAHPDDEVLGFGATAHRLGKLKKDLKTLVICGEADKRYLGAKAETLKKQCFEVSKILNMQKPFLADFPNLSLHNVESQKIVKCIENIIKEFRPKTIVTHAPSDLNIDHQVVSNLCLAAARLPQRRPDYNLPQISNILFMEILSSTDWAFDKNANNFNPNFYCKVDQSDLNAKIKALKCYAGVERPRPHPRNELTINSLALYRGSQCGTNFAESYQSCFTYYANS